MDNNWVLEADYILDDNGEFEKNCDRDNERVKDPNETHNNESETKTDEELEGKWHEMPPISRQDGPHMDIDQARPDTHLEGDLHLDYPSLTV